MVISALINTIQLVMQHVNACHVSSLAKDNFIIKHYMYTSIVIYFTAAATKLFCYMVLNKTFKGPVSPSKLCSHRFYKQ